MFTAKPNASNAWKGIVENAWNLREGVRTEVGNGKRTLFWYHNWATAQPLSSNELQLGDENEDQMVWSGSSHGNFSLKSAIAIIRKEAENERDSFWDFVWQRNLPQRINFFLWLAAHERLMTNANRFARGLALSAACTICDSTEETTLHLLRDCSLARSVWRSLVPHPEQAMFFARPLRN
ncbi:hypothetical protein Cgig2_004931 [Carnegiea gigantea]|uniref:Reverse transcriptase zinc-binding domain-containing protein n=1 Tax=Carnegiea gigantea TaxID=171969 RepID=A0A9Q1QUD4_9CARY|nr:hypothetical protein Cgig2_004931 [Carnegiea gigantea]